jgi:hypothetical protein
MIILVIAVMVVFIISETLVAIAKQNGNNSHNNTAALNSTDSDGKNIVVIWLESNKTNTISAPTISVSNEDFWKIFWSAF